MAAEKKRTRLLPLVALWLAAGWIATGALYKLLAGSPNDLPPVLMQLGIRPAYLFNGAIGIELAVVTFAILKPRMGWVLVALQLMAFLAVLGFLIAQGSASCGCFGSEVSIPPAVMVGIDGFLLLLLFYSRPWSGIATRWLPIPAPIAVSAIALALPWVMSRQVQNTPRSPLGLNGEAAESIDVNLNGPTEGGSGQGSAETEGATGGSHVAAPTEGETGGSVGNATPAPAPTGSGWTVFPTEEWTGKLIFDTELYGYLPPDQVPLDGLVSLYRQGCDHCRDHMLQLMSTEDGQRPLTLIRVPDDEGSTPLVEIKPTGAHVTDLTLIPGIEYVVETPLDIELVGGTIMSVVKPEH